MFKKGIFAAAAALALAYSASGAAFDFRPSSGMVSVGTAACADQKCFKIRPGMENWKNCHAVSKSSAGFCCFDAQVVKVADGDTITAIGPDGKTVRVRLLGIDAPETKMPFGSQSTHSLRELIRDAGSRVTIVYNSRDKYDRILGKLVANGKDLNLEQVKRGLAWAYRHYFKTVEPCDRVLYDKAENQAREQRTGLWRRQDPMAPWDWRKMNRGQK